MLISKPQRSSPSGDGCLTTAGCARRRASRVEVGGDTDGEAFAAQWVCELADGREDRGDDLVAVRVLALQFVEIFDERGVGGQHPAQPQGALGA